MVNNITNLLPRLYIRLRIYIYILARLNIIILFKDFGRAGVGPAQVEGNMGHISKNPRERALDDIGIFINQGSICTDDRLNEDQMRHRINNIKDVVNNIKDVEYLNTEVLAISALWVVENKKLTPSNFKSFTKRCGLNISLIDLLKYIRYLTKK